jgi:hypothetical protein
MSSKQSSKPDLKVAILSVLAATLFWLMNALNKDGYTTKLGYPLKVEFNDSLYIPTMVLPKQISVNVSGNGWTLLRRQFAINALPLIYPIKQPLKTKFINTASLTDLMSDQIKDLKVNYVATDTLELDFDRKVTRKIRIEVDSLDISLRKPYVVSSLINITPRSIMITGPEDLVNGLDGVWIVKIPVKRIDTDYDAEINLDYAKDQNLSLSQDKVQVSFEVDALQAEIAAEPTPAPKPKKEENKPKRKK